MLKLGIQCQEKHEEVYRYNRELKPVVVKSINILDREHYTRLAAENPGVELVYRQVPNGPWDTEEDGKKWAEHLYFLIGHIPEITLVEGHNEYIHAPPHNTPEDFAKADSFMCGFIDRVHELWEGRVHAVVLNASCGHFAEDIADYFPRTLAKLQECSKCLLGLHEYDHPDSDMKGAGEGWLCGKFLRNLAGLKAAGFDKVRIALTEVGVDSGVGAPVGSGHVGFKTWGEMASVRYLNERNLGWYVPLAQETDGVAWLTLFGCGMGGDWATFDIKDTPVIDGIGEIYSNWVPPEPPEPPPNGGDMDVKVFDKFGNELLGTAAEEMVALHGLSWEMPPALVAGDRYFKLIELKEKPSNALIYRVLDLYGNPIVNPDAVLDRSKAHRAFYWPSIDDEADDIEVVFNTDHYQMADLGGLNTEGEGGSGMGRGAYHDPNTPGPHECWVRHPIVWSMIVKGQGMLGGTDHLHLDMTFQEVVYTDGGPPPEEPEEVVELLRGIKSDTGRAVTLLEDIKEALGQQPPEPPEEPEDDPYFAQYYPNKELADPPVLERYEDTIKHDWGPGSPPGVPEDDFSARWTTTRYFKAGTWVFRFRGDDGMRLYIDGKLVFDQWHDQAPTSYEVEVMLLEGFHDLEMQFYERGGGAVCEMWYEEVKKGG